MLYVAFERAGSGNVKPSELFDRVYHTVPHVKSAVAMRAGVGNAFALESEVDGLLTFKKKGAKPHTLFFVNGESVGASHVGTLQRSKPATPKVAKAVKTNGAVKKPVKVAAKPVAAGAGVA